ncbi:unnamed protein product [Medioppia subpectinata]|uniref:Integrator complex subunit 10 n=1 Tax=Medioppia subpectinata TaxID=1979941 RepID=A0A7R9KPN7_9ACAR|nr:unnamed protein product [Medioppia subpectinata]CAG2106093.1 unnamed protein product [Medioppia subpectinata]
MNVWRRCMTSQVMGSDGSGGESDANCSHNRNALRIIESIGVREELSSGCALSDKYVSQIYLDFMTICPKYYAIEDLKIRRLVRVLSTLSDSHLISILRVSSVYKMWSHLDNELTLRLNMNASIDSWRQELPQKLLIANLFCELNVGKYCVNRRQGDRILSSHECNGSTPLTTNCHYFTRLYRTDGFTQLSNRQFVSTGGQAFHQNRSLLIRIDNNSIKHWFVDNTSHLLLRWFSQLWRSTFLFLQFLLIFFIDTNRRFHLSVGHILLALNGVCIPHNWHFFHLTPVSPVLFSFVPLLELLLLVAVLQRTPFGICCLVMTDLLDKAIEMFESFVGLTTGFGYNCVEQEISGFPLTGSVVEDYNCYAFEVMDGLEGGHLRSKLWFRWSILLFGRSEWLVFWWYVLLFLLRSCSLRELELIGRSGPEVWVHVNSVDGIGVRVVLLAKHIGVNVGTETKDMILSDLNLPLRALSLSSSSSSSSIDSFVSNLYTLTSAAMDSSSRNSSFSASSSMSASNSSSPGLSSNDVHHSSTSCMNGPNTTPLSHRLYVLNCCRIDGNEDETREYMISRAKSCLLNGDSSYAKSWIMTANALFPHNDSVKMESYEMSKCEANVEEAVKYLCDMFDTQECEHELIQEFNKIIISCRNEWQTHHLNEQQMHSLFGNHWMNLSQNSIQFYSKLFASLTTEYQYKLLRRVADRTDDKLRFPDSVVENGIKLIDIMDDNTIESANSDSQHNMNQYIKKKLNEWKLFENIDFVNERQLELIYDKISKFIDEFRFRGDTDSPMDLSSATTAMIGGDEQTNQQILYATLLLFLQCLHKYLKLSSDIVLIEQSNHSYSEAKIALSLNKKRKLAEPDLLTANKQLIQIFVVASKALKLLHENLTISSEFNKISEIIGLNSCQSYHSFVIDSNIYRAEYNEVLTQIVNRKTANIKISLMLHDYNSTLKHCLDSIELLPQLKNNPSNDTKSKDNAITNSSTHETSASARQLYFLPLTVDDILNYIIEVIILCLKDRVLLSLKPSDLGIGHLLVLSQYKWPKNVELFLICMSSIRNCGKAHGSSQSHQKFTYHYFFNYVFIPDIIEDVMSIIDKREIALELKPSSALGAQLKTSSKVITTRGVNKGFIEENKSALIQQMKDSTSQCRLHCVQEIRGTIELSGKRTSPNNEMGFNLSTIWLSISMSSFFCLSSTANLGSSPATVGKKKGAFSGLWTTSLETNFNYI